MSVPDSGYEAQILLAFVAAHATERPDGQLLTLNEIAVSYSEREKLARWAKLTVVPTAKVDYFLMQHDLMLFELEHWADQNYGRDGYQDPRVDPLTLAM